MSTQRLLGTLWMVVCGIPGIVYFWMLFVHDIFYKNVFHWPRFYLGVSLCLLYLAGAVAGVFLFCGARWARRFAGSIAALIATATLVGFIECQALPLFYYIVGLFSIALLMFFFVQRMVES